MKRKYSIEANGKKVFATRTPDFDHEVYSYDVFIEKHNTTTFVGWETPENEADLLNIMKATLNSDI